MDAVRAHRSVLVVLATVLLVASAGCSRWSTRRTSPFASETPSAAEIVARINDNAERAHGMLVNDLDISVHQQGQITVPLDGQLAIEKPRQFRLIATNPLTRATEADLGSNNQEFWFYVPRASQRQQLVHCSYADYGAVQSRLPFQPDWLLDSLGLTPVPDDPGQIVHPGRRGTVELITPTRTPQGQPASVITVVQLDSGWIAERHLDVNGRRIASAVLTRHRSDPVYGVTYPGSVAIAWPEAQLEIGIRLDDVQVNPVLPASMRENLWRLPHEVLAAGAEDVDLGAAARPVRPATPAQPPAEEGRRGMWREPRAGR
jgi:hypothetical protein